MKRFIFIIAAYAGFHLAANAQTQLNGGIGYYGEDVTYPGVVLEFEVERYLSEGFSLPLRGDIGFHINPNYNALTIDVHKGFRKYFRTGLFFEQSVGMGIIVKSYKDNYWFSDKYGQSIPHGNRSVLGFMPSVTAGVGYNLSRDKEGSDLIWVRPKIYWDLGFRALHLPYAALQIGFTHTFKTK